jgi:hypothetical protein
VAVGVVLTVGAFLIDSVISVKLSDYLLARQLDNDLVERIVRLAKSFGLLATYYANVFVFLANLVLSFFIFPEDYRMWVFLLDYVILILIEMDLGWLWQYDAIDITDELPALDLPRLGVIFTIESWLRWVQVAFSLFTVIYFAVGYWLAHRW